MAESAAINFNQRATLYSCKPLSSPEADVARRLVKATDLEKEVVDTVVSDLTAIPPNWLKRFKEENVGVVVMKTGQTLADVPLWPEFTTEASDAMIPKCRPAVEHILQTYLGDAANETDPGARGYYLKMAAPEIKKALEEVSEKEQLGFAVHPQSSSVGWSELAATNGIDPEGPRFDHWKHSVETLNQGLVESSPEALTPNAGVVLMPYVGYRGKHFAALTLPSLKSFGGNDLNVHDGANFPENRFLALSDQVAKDPASITGHHRVVLHESGHMIDWITRDMPGIGAEHKQTVESLYAKSMKADKAATDKSTSPILSDRAKDSPGEFFADGVEAFLTLPREDDYVKGDNNRIELEARNPEFFHYLEHVFSL
jgi:hypothetical protein